MQKYFFSLTSSFSSFLKKLFRLVLYIFRFVRPICLPVLTYSMSRSEFIGKESVVSGWGLHTFTPVINGHGPYAQRLKVSTRSR